MKVPFIGGSYTGRSPNVNAQQCVNYFLGLDKSEPKDENVLIGTPGLDVFVALVAESSATCVRCVHVMRDTLYVVVGNQVYSVSNVGVKTLLGTITTSSGNVFMSDNGTQVIIVDGTASGYYIQAGVLALISDADFPIADSVTFQDGYFLITEHDTGRIWISGSYDATTWDALDFTTAETSPDYALRVMATQRELWVFGEDTIEPYYNSGNTDFPFERIVGTTLPVGLGAVASVVIIGGVFYWLSDKGKVMCNSGYTPNVISPPTIDYQFSTYATINDAIGYTFTMDGHDFYALVFPTMKKTWCYDTTTTHWFEWESYYNKDPDLLYSRHRSNCCVRFNNKEIVGDYENGKLYMLNMSTYTDNGSYIRRIRAGQHLSKDRNNVVYHNFEIEFEAGVGKSGSITGTVELANMRISAVDGTAFVDFSLPSVLTGYLGDKLTVTDSAGNQIVGYIKAAGVGETLGSELITGWTNFLTHGYDTFTSVGTNITSAIKLTDNSASADTNTFAVVQGTPYKVVTARTLNSGSAPHFNMYNPSVSIGTLGSATIYIVAPSTVALAYFMVVQYVAGNWSSTFTCKRLLTPSATGVTIVSESGGSTYNWTSKDSGFNYNDASGYTYTIDELIVEDPIATLDWSNDGGHTWSNSYSVSVGKVGEYEQRAVWRKLGIGRSRVFRVTVYDPTKWVILGAYAELEALKS